MQSVLIIDDEKIVLDVLQRILSRLGYRPIITESWEIALDLYSSASFDLVLMDVLMPEKNGFEIAREMRKIRPDQKIVLVTGIGAEMAAAQAEAEEVGIEYVLPKPFSYDKVKHVLAEVLQSDNQLVQ